MHAAYIRLHAKEKEIFHLSDSAFSFNFSQLDIYERTSTSDCAAEGVVLSLWHFQLISLQLMQYIFKYVIYENPDKSSQ